MKMENRKILVQFEADLAKISRALSDGARKFEVHFAKDYPNLSRGLMLLTKLIEEYAAQTKRRAKITVYKEDGKSVALAAGVGALGGALLEGVLIGRWFGPVGILVGASAATALYMYSRNAFEIEISAHIPGPLEPVLV